MRSPPRALDERAAYGAVPDEGLPGLDRHACAERVADRRSGRLRPLRVVLLGEHEQERLRLEPTVFRRDGRNSIDGAASLTLVLFGIELERDVGRDGGDRDESSLVLRCCPGCGTAVETRSLLEDRALELAERRGRLEPALCERRPCRLVDVECGLLAPAAIQRDHQLPVPALARRNHLHECLELSDQLARLPDRELRLDPFLLRFLTELLEPCDLGLCERLEREVGERVAAPQGKRIGRASCRAHRLADAGLGEQLLETNGVQRPGVDVEHVAGRPREQRQVVAEQAPQA